MDKTQAFNLDSLLTHLKDQASEFIVRDVWRPARLINGNLGYGINKQSAFTTKKHGSVTRREYIMSIEKMTANVLGNISSIYDETKLFTGGLDPVLFDGDSFNWSLMFKKVNSLLGVKGTEPVDTRILPQFVGDNYVMPIFNMLCSVGKAAIKSENIVDYKTLQKMSHRFKDCPNTTFVKPFFNDNHVRVEKNGNKFLTQGDFECGPPLDDIRLRIESFNAVAIARSLKANVPFVISRINRVHQQLAFEFFHMFGRKSKTNLMCDVNIPLTSSKPEAFIYYYKEKGEDWIPIDDKLVDLGILWNDPASLWNHLLIFVNSNHLHEQFYEAYELFLSVLARPMDDTIEGFMLLDSYNTLLLPQPVYMRTMSTKAFVEQDYNPPKLLPPLLRGVPVLTRWISFSVAMWYYFDLSLALLAEADFGACFLNKNFSSCLAQYMGCFGVTNFSTLYAMLFDKKMSTGNIRFINNDSNYLLHNTNSCIIYTKPKVDKKWQKHEPGTFKFKRHLASYVLCPLIKAVVSQTPSFIQDSSVLNGSVTFVDGPYQRSVVKTKREVRLLCHILRELRYRVYVTACYNSNGFTYQQTYGEEVAFGADSRALANPLVLEGFEQPDEPVGYIIDIERRSMSRVHLCDTDLHNSIFEIECKVWNFVGYHNHRDFWHDCEVLLPNTHDTYVMNRAPSPENRNRLQFLQTFVTGMQATDTLAREKVPDDTRVIIDEIQASKMEIPPVAVDNVIPVTPSHDELVQDPVTTQEPVPAANPTIESNVSSTD